MAKRRLSGRDSGTVIGRQGLWTLRFGGLLLTLLLLVACTETATDTSAPEPSPVAETPTEDAPTTPLDAAALAPVMREMAEAGVGPNSMVIEFAQPIVDDGQVGQLAAEGTVLHFEPAVEGSLRFTSTSTLTFEPSRGFAPNTSYSAELRAVQTRDGLLSPPESKRWLRQFKTPEFRFVRFSLQDVNYPKKRASVRLTFSGRVEASEVARFAEISATPPNESGRQKTSLRFEPGPSPQTAVAVLSGDALVPGTRLDLVLRDGTPFALDKGIKASSSRASVHLEKGDETTILNAYTAEGSNGFYVQVICNDTSVDTRRYYWDRVNYNSYEISSRCLLDETDAADGVHFDPPVDFTLASAGGGFRIFGDFSRGSYKMRIDAGVRTADGGMVLQTYEKDFSVPARSPQMAFVSQGRYLPRSAWKSLPIRHMNVSGASLEVRHVPSENLVFWMSDDDESANERTSNLVVRKQIPLRGDPDTLTTSYVDLGSLLSADTKGLLEIRVRSGNARASSRLLLTDMHLIAKRAAPADGTPKAAAQRAVQAWAVDMETVAPLNGVEIQLLRKSGFVLASCRTDRDGGCRLQPGDDEVDLNAPFALVARHQGDLTYLKFDELKAEVQEARIAGEPYRSAQKYRAAIYSDRGVYRPGETAHLAAILRQEDNLAPPADMPVQTKLLDPQGQVIKSQALQTNGAGYVTLDLPFPAFATTGRYEAQMLVGDRKVGQYSFQVEEFVPERMKVDVGTAESQFKLGDDLAVAVEARYLFGGVPAEHQVEVSCELVPGTFDPPQNANFQYGVWQNEDAPTRPLDLGRLTAKLDGEGKGTYICPGRSGAGRGPTFRGPARLLARAAVFEGGSGRTTVGQSTAPVHPESYYLGLQSSATKVESGQELVVEGITVDWQGSKVTSVPSVELELVRLETEYGWYFDENLGRDTYRRYRRPVSEIKSDVAVTDGTFRVTWKPEQNGEYFLVRASAGEARTELPLEGSGDWYWWEPDETESERTPRPGRPTWLALQVPEQTKVGERFPISFKAPYRGRVLLTAETDRVLRSEWLDVDAGDAVWFVKLDDFVPNVYVTAFLVKDPHLDSAEAFMPDRAFGVSSVRVEPTAFHRPLSLEAPTEVRSNSTLTVRLDLGKAKRDDGPTFATVAAVDEGVLSLTRFVSPDPSKDIFVRRALGVETFETVGWTLLMPPGGPSSTAGGDQQAELGRVQAVKPVALWSGLLPVPDNGKLDVTFQVPQYRGELRVMAVSSGGKRLSHGQASVTVRDPLVVQSTVPRFLTADDSFQIPVMVTNLSGSRRDIEVRLSAEALEVPGFDRPLDDPSPVTVEGDSLQRLQLDDGKAGTVTFRARARTATGAAQVRVEVSSGDLSSVETTDVPLLPAAPKSRRVQRLELTEGTTDLTPYLEGWVPLTERSTIWVTKNPYGQVFDHLKHLVRYPYGCIEQTTSSSRPLLYLASMLESVDPALTKGVKVEDMVQAGIDRLFSMQTPSGGFAYWPGGVSPTYWGTAYASHFLIDARKAGYRVSQDRLDESLDWMERQITNHYEAGQEDWHSRHSEPYFHYVLALSERPRKARIQKLLEAIPERPKTQQREEKFMLQAALYMAGDHSHEAALKRPELTPVSDDRSNGWSFYSDRRMRGFMLSTSVDLFGRDVALEPLANLVAEALQSQRSSYYTTQELVWGITGLGKFVENGTIGFTPPVLKAGGRTLQAQENPRPISDRTWSLVRASEYKTLTVDVKDKNEGKLYLILSSEGVREVPDWRTGGEGLRLQRRYLDAGGQPLEGSIEMDLGALVYIELSLSNTTAERVSNIALVDRIPAGWEIENPRLGRDGSVDWIDQKQVWEADHMNLRDDRLEVFGHLEKGQSRKVTYAVRAVTAGQFTAPPVEAEAMYDPRIWAREDGRAVTVLGPWDASPKTASTTPATASTASVTASTVAASTVAANTVAAGTVAAATATAVNGTQP